MKDSYNKISEVIINKNDTINTISRKSSAGNDWQVLSDNKISISMIKNKIHVKKDSEVIMSVCVCKDYK